MENELKANLLACLATFARFTGRSSATIAQAAAGDWRFFDRIQTGSFTARKYDLVMVWFSRNWPADLAWPDRVERPAVKSSAPSQNGFGAADGHGNSVDGDYRSTQRGAA